MNWWSPGPTDHVFITIDTSKGLFDRTQYGINYPFLYSASTKTIPNKIPTIGITNFGTLDGGPYPSHSGGIVYDIGDNVTKVLGNHTLKAGFNFEYAGEKQLRPDQRFKHRAWCPPTTRTASSSASPIRATI